MLLLSLLASTLYIIGGIIGLAICCLILYGNLIDWNPFNAHLHDNREDPLSDWDKNRIRAKIEWDKMQAKERKKSFWNRIFGDPYADALLDDMLQREMNLLDCQSGFNPMQETHISHSSTGNYYDRNELKSVEEIIRGSTRGHGNYIPQVPNKVSPPASTFRPIVVVDEVHRGNAETAKKIAEEVEFELLEPYKGESIPLATVDKNGLVSMKPGKAYRIPAWVLNEAGDAIDPLQHEQTK